MHYKQHLHTRLTVTNFGYIGCSIYSPEKVKTKLQEYQNHIKSEGYESDDAQLTLLCIKSIEVSPVSIIIKIAFSDQQYCVI